MMIVELDGIYFLIKAYNVDIEDVIRECVQRKIILEKRLPKTNYNVSFVGRDGFVCDGYLGKYHYISLELLQKIYKQADIKDGYCLELAILNANKQKYPHLCAGYLQDVQYFIIKDGDFDEY